MSHTISSTLPSINHTDQYQLTHHRPNRHTHFSDQTRTLQQDSYHRSNADSSFKAFDSLTNSLTRAVTDAVKVDTQTGEEEIRKGGLQRVAKDLQKLFKGMGFTPQLAKQYAREISSAMGQDGVDQIDFSLATTKSLTVTGYNQAGQAASTDTQLPAASQASGYQLTAVQTQSFDVSINLTTGEFTLNRSSEESMTLTSLATPPGEELQQETPDNSEVAASDPEEAAITPPAAEIDAVEESLSEDIPIVAEETGDPGANILFQINRSISQSAVLNRQPINTGDIEEEAPDMDTDLPNSTFVQLQQFVEINLQMSWGETNLFESLTEIHNLRVEAIDQQDYLRFNIQSTVPMGLTAAEEDGTRTTLYPRSDGSTGEITTDPDTVSA